ncbi:hypothetical protein V6N12_010676 [Hibiscus sabdariffa]|uniref:Uncharacterized protein n=1 Tax=Hibiscus sabdariffa TaxID=183260 RepID=A0ABR2EKS3_9ROSI
MILPVLAMGTFQHPGTAGPISGQSNGAADGGSSRISAKQPSQRSAPPPADGMYRAPTIGQPVGGPLVSAVSRPVNLPAPAHLGYGVTVPCAPMNMTPAGCEAATYPMPHTTTDSACGQRHTTLVKDGNKRFGREEQAFTKTVLLGFRHPFTCYQRL